MRTPATCFLNCFLSSIVLLFAVGCSQEFDEHGGVSEDSDCPSDGFRTIEGYVHVDTSGIVMRSVSESGSHNKSAGYTPTPDDVTDTHFHNGGYTSINGLSLKTVIIGNQRWTVKDYTLSIDAFGEDWSDSELWSRFLFKRKLGSRYVYYYPYEFAMTFTDFEAEEDDMVPDGFEATTGWRIPSEEDVSNMYHMAADNYVHNLVPDLDDYIINNLKLERTDLYVLYSVYIPGSATEIGGMNKSKEAQDVIYENFGLFWNSDKHAQTYTFAGLGNDGDFWYCQSNRDTICAPIRFVQNIKPIDFND